MQKNCMDQAKMTRVLFASALIVVQINGSLDRLLSQTGTLL
jgi:hypothetical protein